MKNKNYCTASNIRYLIALLTLNKNNGGVRSVDLANFLDIAKPSVHNKMNTFISLGLVTKDFYGLIYFTPNGLTIAKQYNELYKKALGLLKKAVNANEEELQPAALSLVACLPKSSSLYNRYNAELAL